MQMVNLPDQGRQSRLRAAREERRLGSPSPASATSSEVGSNCSQKDTISLAVHVLGSWSQAVQKSTQRRHPHLCRFRVPDAPGKALLKCARLQSSTAGIFGITRLTSEAQKCRQCERRLDSDCQSLPRNCTSQRTQRITGEHQRLSEFCPWQLSFRPVLQAWKAYVDSQEAPEKDPAEGHSLQRQGSPHISHLTGGSQLVVFQTWAGMLVVCQPP